MSADQPPSWLFYVPVIWLAGVLLASILYRRAVGRSIFPRSPAAARFNQSGASGWSEDNWLRSIGGANNCLVVAVTDQELIVTPSFPFNLMFLPEIWGLEIRTHLSGIDLIEPTSRLFKKALRIELKNGQKFALVVRDRERFREAVGRF